MKTGRAFHTLALWAALVLAGSQAASAGLAAQTAGSQGRDPATDPSGMIALGIDITNAGNTSKTVGAFFADLSSRQRYGLTNGCRSLLAAPLSVNLRVLSFCRTLGGITANAPVVHPPRAWGS